MPGVISTPRANRRQVKKPTYAKVSAGSTATPSGRRLRPAGEHAQCGKFWRSIDPTTRSKFCDQGSPTQCHLPPRCGAASASHGVAWQHWKEQDVSSGGDQVEWRPLQAGIPKTTRRTNTLSTTEPAAAAPSARTAVGQVGLSRARPSHPIRPAQAQAFSPRFDARATQLGPAALQAVRRIGDEPGRYGPESVRPATLAA